MSDAINIREAKAQLSGLVARAEAGEEVIISRANRPVARLVPMEPARGKRRLGRCEGEVVIHEDFDDMPEDFLEHFSQP